MTNMRDNGTTFALGIYTFNGLCGCMPYVYTPLCVDEVLSAASRIFGKHTLGHGVWPTHIVTNCMHYPNWEAGSIITFHWCVPCMPCICSVIYQRQWRYSTMQIADCSQGRSEPMETCMKDNT